MEAKVLNVRQLVAMSILPSHFLNKSSLNHNELREETGGSGTPRQPAADENEQPRILGAVQITPSLFIGDKNSSIDANFIQANKITAVINTAYPMLKNIFSQTEYDKNVNLQQYMATKPQAASLVGKIEYLNLQWQDL